MDFVGSDFDACWAHIQQRARADQESGAWIATRMGKEGNQVVEVAEKSIRIRSKRPTGKGWADIPLSQFRRIWRWLGREQGSLSMPRQATMAMLIRYFDDIFWDEGGGTIVIRRPPGVLARSPGPSPHERRPRVERAVVEGRHKAIHEALEDALDDGDGWSVATISPASGLVPDLLVRGDECSVAVIFEIKSTGSFADIYEAVGQLLIYESLFCEDDDTTHRVIVMPDPPDGEDITAALDEIGIDLFEAVEEDGEWLVPGLSESVADWFEPE